MSPLFWVGICCCAASLAITLEVMTGMRRMTRLRDVAVPPAESGPLVSIVIPACNEAATIEPALRSVLAMDYANREIIVVNDRSTDGTADVLARLAAEHPALRILHITDLPAGWLGKSHALQYGAERANGDYLLFTDADIIMERTTLSRAMHHVRTHGLEHLSILFEHIGGSGLLNALFLDICAALLLLYRPWLAKNPRSRQFMGVGAFNLVKTSAYRAIGRHRRIAMHPIDDIMLGKLLKRHGCRQDCLLGNGFVSVHWYETVGQCINGLMKNSFALYNYRLSGMAAGVLFVFFLGVLPPWAAVFADNTARLPFLAAVALRLLSFVNGFRETGGNPAYAAWSLATPYVAIYTSVTAAIRTIRHNGIDWRGTHYPLDELKRSIV
ncbi:MAG: glycosyltransferase [Thermodesulfobacteriota bacterium]